MFDAERRAWRWLGRALWGVPLVLCLASLIPAVAADFQRRFGTEHAAVEVFRGVAAIEAATFEPSDPQAYWRTKRAREAMLEQMLEERFPNGSDAGALIAFLSDGGLNWRARCDRGAEESRHHYRCIVIYGSLVASILGIHRLSGGEWVIGIALQGDSERIERIGCRVPFLGKG